MTNLTMALDEEVFGVVGLIGEDVLVVRRVCPRVVSTGDYGVSAADADPIGCLLGVVCEFRVLPADQRREADDEGQDPDSGDENFCPSRRHDRGIVDRTGYGDVAVEGDGAEVKDGRGAHPNVYRQPDGTPEITEYPNLQERILIEP